MKNAFTKLSLVTIIFVAVLIVDLFALPNKVNNYTCSMPDDIRRTILIDSDNNGVYDVYEVEWCEDSEVNDYPIQATIGVDQVCIFDDWMNSTTRKNKKKKVFAEIYTNRYTGIDMYKFEKYEGIDTVYFTPILPRKSDDLTDAAGTFEVLPNPAKSDVRVYFSLSSSNQVVINLFNSEGVKVVNLIDENKPKGEFDLRINTSNLPSGVYFVQGMIGHTAISKKLSIIK